MITKKQLEEMYLKAPTGRMVKEVNLLLNSEWYKKEFEKDSSLYHALEDVCDKLERRKIVFGLDRFKEIVKEELTELSSRERYKVYKEPQRFIYRLDYEVYPMIYDANNFEDIINELKEEALWDIRFWLPEEYKEKFITGIDQDPATNLAEGYFSKWKSKWGEVWIYSKFLEEEKIFKYGATIIDPYEVLENYESHIGLEEVCDYIGMNKEEFKNSLPADFLTAIQDHDNFVFEYLDKAKTIKDMLDNLF